MLILVPLAHLEDNPFQARRDYGDIAELAEAIRSQLPNCPDTLGLLQPPTGRLIWRNAANPDGHVLNGEQLTRLKLPERWDPALYVQLEFGHRRVRAFRHLFDAGHQEYSQMPVFLRVLDDDQMLDGCWSENRARRDLSAVEEAEMLRLKLERAKADGGSQRTVAAAWGLDRSTIANRLRLLELPEEIQQANRSGLLSERQCLSLAPLTQLQQLEGHRGQPLATWSKQTSPAQWGDPMPPDKYIDWLIANPGTSSDDVRQHVARSLVHAGRQIAALIAKTDFDRDGRPDIIQASCSGCPFRVNNHCLEHPCLDAKERQHIYRAVADASVELGIPFSDRDEDFDGPQAGAFTIKRLRDAGIKANFVVGWRGHGSRFRPYHGDMWLSKDAAFDDDGRAGIVLGHRGSVDPFLADLPDRGADVGPPLPAVVARAEELEKSAAKISKSFASTVKHHLIGWLYHDGFDDVLQALIMPPDTEWLDEHDQITGKLIDLLWAHGRGVISRYYPADQVAVIEQFVRRAGLIGAPAITPADRATLALSFWCRNHQYSYNNPDIKRHFLAAITAVEKSDHLRQPELGPLLTDLQDCLAYIEAKEAQEAVKAELASTSGAG